MVRTKTPAGVVFDLGGVILTFDHMDICRPLAELTPMTPEEIYDAIFRSGLEELYDKGKITSEEFYHEGTDLLCIDRSRLSFEKFSRIWSEIFSLDTDVAGILDDLRNKTRLFLLSNTNELHYEYARKMFPIIEEAFETSFLSFRLGTRKPEKEIFQTVVEKTGLLPDELFYIDDFPGHVEAAEALGIPGVVYTSPEDLKRSFKVLGL